MPQPALPAMLTMPSTKSVGASGSGSGSQRSWLGGVGTSSKPWPAWLSQRSAPAYGSNGSCTAAGRSRYSHERRFACRGAVKAVPDSCSAYSP